MNPLIALSYEVGNDVILGALLVGLVIFAGGLIASMNIIKGWIREVAGVKETTSTEISGQPVKVKEAKEYLTVRAHAEACGHMERRVTALEGRATLIERKMDTDKTEIIDAGEDRAIKIHDRINAVLSAVSEVKGQVFEISKRV